MAKSALYGISLHNFGVLRKAELTGLSGVNVLVGANASGKTTLLKSIGFLGDAVRMDLLPALAKYGGYERLRTRDGTTEPMKIHIQAIVTSHAHEGALDEYELSVSKEKSPFIAPADLIVRKESFQFKRTARQGRRITIRGRKISLHDERMTSKTRSLDSSSLGLSTLPRLGASEGGDEVRKIAELFSTFRVFEADVKKAQMHADERTGSTLFPDASNLAAFLAYLRREHSDTFAQLVADARTMAPGLVDIHLANVGGAGDFVRVELEEKGLTSRTYLEDASFGTVRALAILAMLYDPTPPLLTCIEEIDHGLHPYVFDRLIDLLRSASERTQFLVATHSPALVNRLRAEELIVCERDAETGVAKIPAIPRSTVKKIMESGENLGLGELWFSGSLGGVP